MKSVPAGYSGKQLPAELGLESGTREAFVSAAEYHPVLLEDVWMDIQYVAPEITDVRVRAYHMSQVFVSNEVMWSCDGHHLREWILLS
jgi:hypothetical protein